jgi:MEMO1 family protein
MSDIRPAAIAGSWYSANAEQLAGEVDGYLEAAAGTPSVSNVVALIAPHAGLMYSGHVAAHAYRQLHDRAIDTLVIVGPSHFVTFDGVAFYGKGGFASPLGVAEIDDALASELMAATPVIHQDRGPHRREHSLEMQLPFVRRVVPQARIVPLLVGHQTDVTATALGEALGQVCRNKSVVLIASTDLSHYESSTTARALDSVVLQQVEKFDPDGLQAALRNNPQHACGGGPAVAVMRAARTLGATRSAVLNYADSGDVSGDKSSVVGYMAAVMSAA